LVTLGSERGAAGIQMARGGPVAGPLFAPDRPVAARACHNALVAAGFKRSWRFRPATG
jgi:hypothetical protein